MTPSWYDLLDVEPDATTDEIRTAWRRAIDGLEPTDRRFAIRNQAAAVLLDPAERAAYDAELAGGEVDPPVVVTRPAERAARPGTRTATAPAPASPKVELSKPAVARARDRTRDAGPPRTVPGWLLVGLAAVVLLMAGLAGYLHTQSDPPGAVDDAAQAARATAERATADVFAYDYRDMEGSQAAATSFMSDRFAQEDFEPVFAVLIENAARLKPEVTSEFIESSVTLAEVERVDVLVLFNQTTRRADLEVPQVARNFATLRMVLVDGNWVIDDITTATITE